MICIVFLKDSKIWTVKTRHYNSVIIAVSLMILATFFKVWVVFTSLSP